MQKGTREFIKRVRALGLSVDSADTTAKGHVKLRVRNGERTFVYVLPSTGSDVRGEKNALAAIKQALLK